MKIVIKSLQLIMTFRKLIQSVSANTADRLRVIVVIDTQSNGAVPVVGDILNSATNVIDSFRNLANVKRFTFLMDKIYTLRNTGAVLQDVANTAGANNMHVRKTFKMNLPVHYNSTTGTITEVRDNSIYVFVISDFLDSSITLVDGNSRLRWSDM